MQSVFPFQPPAGHTTLSGGGRASEAKANIAFVLVPVFFLLGLLGVVICHVLKRKGYRCTTEPQDGEEEQCQDMEKDAELGEGREMPYMFGCEVLLCNQTVN